MPAGKRASSVMGSQRRFIHDAWISLAGLPKGHERSSVRRMIKKGVAAAFAAIKTVPQVRGTRYACRGYSRNNCSHRAGSGGGTVAGPCAGLLASSVNHHARLASQPSPTGNGS